MSIESLLRIKATAEAAKPHLEVVPSADIPNQPKIPNQDNQPNVTKPTQPTAPTRDFAKVPNSLTRHAIPERYFKGMSKSTYDALYSRTRGAINPIRRIRATKSDLIRWCGVSDVTIDKHIKHLKSVGLLKVDFIIGSHEGNWYEVLIPEEIDLPNQDNQPNQPYQANIPKKVGGLVPNLVGDVGGVQLLENKDISENPNTSSNTKNNIDDEFAPLIGVLRSLGKGKPDNWHKLGELLKREFLAAESYTDSVTDAPAFLTEHLKRKLEQPAKAKSAAKEKPFEPGKVEPATAAFTPDPLSKKGRETVLDNLRKMPPDEIETHRGAYTADDWSWLISRLN